MIESEMSQKLEAEPGIGVEEPMNVKEAAAFLRCAVSTIYRETANGCIPCIRMGKRVLFLKSDLIEWLKTMRTMPAIS